jgi:glycosyltransferase involved in cell wall biosynthesis
MRIVNQYDLLVSILTPTYNHRRFIGAGIESLLKQTASNWEQIIIDDGSTDSTGDLVRKYSDPRIRYFYQENHGIDALAETYNHALSLARGNLIAILEGDDLWPHDKLATLVPKFADPELVLAYGAVRDVDIEGQRQRGKNRSDRWRQNLPLHVLSNDPIASATKFMLQARGPSLIPAPTVIVRRSALENIGGFQSFPGLRTTDYPTYLLLSLEGKFHYERQIMGFQRRHLGSVTATNLESGHFHAGAFAREFAERYGRKINLTASELMEIRASWQKSRPMVDFSLGRASLIKRDWHIARNHFRAAIKYGEPLVRIASIAGWLSSWLHLNLEPVMRGAGRAALR